MASVRTARPDPRTGQARVQAVAQRPPGGTGPAQATSLHPDTRQGRRAALRWAEDVETAQRQAAAAGDRGPLYIGDWYRQARGSLRAGPRALADTDAVIAIYWEPRWGRIPIHQWDPSGLEAWLGRLQTGPNPGDRLPAPDGTFPTVGPDRARAVVTRLGAVLTRAVRDGRLARSPLRGLELPAASPARPRYMPEPALLACLPYLPEWARAPIYGLAYTGVRLGELNGLTAASVLDGGRSLRVECTVVEDDACRMSWKLHPKGREHRVVPLPAHVADVWLAHRAAWPASPVTLPRYDGRGTARPDTWFRAGASGNPICRHRLDDAFKAAQRREHVASGRPGDPTLYRVSDLRHLFASILLTAGRSLAEVGDLMGHRDPRTTRIYAHLVDGWQSAARVALDRPAVRLYG